MLVARSAFSDNPDPEAAARQVGDDLAGMVSKGDGSVALFFATAEYGPSFERISRMISGRAGIASVVGCSAAGVVAPPLRDGTAGLRGISALALCGTFEAERFLLTGLRGRSDEIGREIGRLAAGRARDPATVLLLADSYNVAPDELLAGVADGADAVSVIGAGATEKGASGETSVAAHGASAANAVAGLVIRGLSVAPVLSPVLAPIGPWWTVTDAEANRIHALDRVPALERILGALPQTLRENPDEALGLVHVALAEVDGDESPLLRPIIGADPDRGTLVVGDEVPPGTRVAIAAGDPALAREQLDASLARLTREGAPAAALYFHSALPGQEPYGLPDLDTAYVRRGLGDAAIAGFASYVTFAPRRGRNRFHHFSGLLAGFASS